MIDPKPPKRVKASKKQWEMWHDQLVLMPCALCGRRATNWHHLSKHPRDDVPANLLALCGSGTTGCHGRVEARDPVALAGIRDVLTAQQLAYLLDTKGEEWLRKVYPEAA